MDWRDYYDKTGAREPRPLLMDALALFEEPGFAIDVGSGPGVESRELLRAGWRVLAVDAEPAAAEYLLRSVSPEEQVRLNVETVDFAAMQLPHADLVWSSLSLSFCDPAAFERVWRTVKGAVRPGGRLACDVFATRHAWSSRPGMTFLSVQQVREMLAGFQIEVLNEVEAERETAFDGLKHWHAVELIVRRPGAPGSVGAG
jgi:SAM-dependent methyltransferase